MRTSNFSNLPTATTPAILRENRRAAPEVAAIARTPICRWSNLAITGLRAICTRMNSNIRTDLQWLVESDGQIELFEYVLQKIVAAPSWSPQFSQIRQPVVQYYSIKPLAARLRRAALRAGVCGQR